MVEPPLGHAESGRPPAYPPDHSSRNGRDDEAAGSTAVRGKHQALPGNRARSHADADSANATDGNAAAKKSITTRLVQTGGALGTLAALILSYLAWSHPQPAEPLAAELRAVGMDVSRLEEIPYEPVDDVGGGEAGALDILMQDSVIDVQVENRGGSPILVTEIEATILYAELLIACPATRRRSFRSGPI
jgi:hypothetical protein